jgi:transcriptional regulator with XRE-family HTH domain
MELDSPNVCVMVDTPETQLQAISRRLRELREAMGYSQATMARIAGIGPTTWNNYETAIRRISLDEAMKVCSATGATLDWIYRGEGIGQLPRDLALKLRRTG